MLHDEDSVGDREGGRGDTTGVYQGEGGLKSSWSFCFVRVQS